METDRKEQDPFDESANLLGIPPEARYNPTIRQHIELYNLLKQVGEDFSNALFSQEVESLQLAHLREALHSPDLGYSLEDRYLVVGDLLKCAILVMESGLGEGHQQDDLRRKLIKTGNFDLEKYGIKMTETERFRGYFP